MSTATLDELVKKFICKEVVVLDSKDTVEKAGKEDARGADRQR